MPVYIRKNVSFTPPSIYNMQLEDDNDYLLDPDQLRDILPQPYRMINKILTQLVDNVWEIVETKDNAVLAEARKIRPPRFEETQMLEMFENISAMTASNDGKFVFFGIQDGLGAIDALTQKELSTWQDENINVTRIQSYQIGPEFHFLIVLDDMGTIRLFLFVFEKFILVKTLNENAPEATSKTLCHECEASHKGDYLGALFENTGTKEMWVEIHKLPIESWISELEALSASNKQKDQEIKEAEHVEEAQNSEQAEATAVAEASQTKGLDTAALKFSHPVQILKIKPPPEHPLSGNPSSSVASALSKVDSGDVVGTGINHILSTGHLESQDVIFKHRHESHLKYLPTEKEERIIQAKFHFLGASNMISVGLDQTPADNRPVSVAIWWAGTPHLCQYSLLKPPGKDLEFKPDVVWPFTNMITCSAPSVCTSYVAVGLENGNVVLWNRMIGICKAVLTASHRSAVKSVRFLDTCLFPGETAHYPPYPTSGATFLLVECVDGTQSLFDTCDGSQQIPRCVANRPEFEEDKQILLQVIPNLPELMILTQKDGNMYIKDIGTGKAICQIVLPATHKLQCPWDPIFAIGGGGQILFVKGEGTEIDEEGERTDISGVFMYHLRSYPLFDEYWKRGYTGKPLMVYTTLDQRVTPLMQERIQQQALRKPRLQQRWSQLRSELDIIQMGRQAPLNSMRITF